MNRVVTAVGLVLMGMSAWMAGPQARQAAGGPPPGPPQAPGQTTAAPTVPTSAVIVGQVVDGDTGDPVNEVIVTVSMRAAPPGGGRATGAAPGSAPATATQIRVLTTAEGKFVVRDLPAGALQLSASAPGYMTSSYGQARVEGPPQPLTIAPGTRVLDLKMRIWRAAALAGVVTDEGGEPLPGVMVRALRRTYQRGQARMTPRGTVTTDDRGMYRIGGLAPGDYVVSVPQTMVSAPASLMDGLMQGVLAGDPMSAGAGFLEVAMSGGGMAAQGVRIGDMTVGTQSGGVPRPDGKGGWLAYGSRYAAGAEVASAATLVSLRSGEERAGLHVTLPLLPTFTISGVVSGPSGPVANVGVRLRHAAETLVVDGMSDVGTATTRADGTFMMAAVPAGTYVVRVVRPSRPPLDPRQLESVPEEMRATMTAMFAQNPGDNRTLFASLPLALDRHVEGLQITLGAGATVSGRVDFPGATETPPFARVTMALSPIDAEWVTGVSLGMQSGRAGDDGTFTTMGSPPGRYSLGLSQGMTVPGWVLKSVVVDGRDVLFDALELEGRDVTGALVTFTSKPASINGAVQAPSGGAAAAASTVVVFPAAWREWVAGGMNSLGLRVVRTAADGTFNATGLPPREYLVVAVPAEAAPDTNDPSTFEALVRLATPVTLAEGETRTTSLRQQAFGRGRQ